MEVQSTDIKLKAGTGEFPAQRASNAENVPIWWRHHDCIAAHVVCVWNI